MLALSLVFVVLSLRIAEGLGAALQMPLEMPGAVSKPRKLHGRFLHITDMHPDGHYRTHAAESKACHRKDHTKKKNKNSSGYYGSAYSECDSPFRLTNFTLDYLAKTWAHEIDFVIWTGDSARHDNDHQIPRTPDEIFSLNRAVTAKMEQIFTHNGIPVVPSLGNNDIWPHNILSPGPNRITTEFSSIWSNFIPFTYRQVFQRGAYYAREIFPDELAVISLNTLYFYDSNKVVDGCPYDNPEDPGNLELDWLEVQLQSYYDRGMQVYISGHVPPSPGNYFPECYVRYVELALRYQNVIVGHLFGHMNIDHFFFLESIDLDIIPEEEKQVHTSGNDEALYDVLLNEFKALPAPKKVNYDEYVVVNVAPSVVPQYLPSFRIFSYNVTDTRENVEQKKGKKKRSKKPPKRKHGHRRGDGGNKTHLCRKPEYQNSWKCHLDEPWNSDEDSPSRTNTYWSPLGYAQYNMPNLDDANKTNKPRYKLEYVTFPLERLRPGEDFGAETFEYPIPPQFLPKELLDVSVTKSKYAPYKMEDLTIPSWVRLAQRVADDKRVKLRKKFKKYMFAGAW